MQFGETMITEIDQILNLLFEVFGNVFPTSHDSSLSWSYMEQEREVVTKSSDNL